jgi:hypothetical protein
LTERRLRHACCKEQCKQRTVLKGTLEIEHNDNWVEEQQEEGHPARELAQLRGPNIRNFDGYVKVFRIIVRRMLEAALLVVAGVGELLFLEDSFLTKLAA